MAFLAYRFIPAGADRRAGVLAAAAPAAAGGLAGGARDGRLPDRRLRRPDVRARAHDAPRTPGFITGLFVVLTPLFGALLFGLRVGRAAWAAAVVSAFGLLLLSGAGGDFDALGRRRSCSLCACAFAIHILVTARAVARFDVGALVAIQLDGLRPLLPRRRGGRRASSRRRAAPPSGAR